MLKRTEWRYFNELVVKSEVISFASAAPSFEVISKYFGVLRNENVELLEEIGPAIFNYADIKGDESLRRELASKGLVGENANKDMVLITNGGQEAIKLITETMLKKGDRVMIERLGYVGLEQTILSSGGEIRCFSDNLNKLKLSEIEQELRKSKPKLVYLIPDFSNPCGDNLREDVRKLMVKLATKLSFWVIEDQTYREIYFDKNEHLASMFSRSDKVIIVGSISKIIVPGLRIGWLVTKDDLLRQKITQLKESFTLSTNNLSQKLIARLLETEYEKMIRWVRNYYGKKMKKTLENLEKNIPERFSFSKPRGGFYIWIEGPEGFQAKKTLNLALGNGIGFMPGGVFYYNNKKANTFRLSISAIKEKDIKDGIDRLTKTLEGKKLLIKKNIGWKGKIKEFILNLHHRLQLMFVR